MSGAEHLKASLRRIVARPASGEMPRPSDPWGVWVEYRLKRLEDGQQWTMRLILGALVAQFALEVLNML